MDSTFYVFDEDDQGNRFLNEDYPGLEAILLDELATRGRFTWRDTYAIYQGPGDNANCTWTDLSMWSTDRFDISADWWLETLERLKLGVAFPEGWYKGDMILVGAKQGESFQKINIWGWLEPFDTIVWVVILATILAAGIIYQVLEHLGHEASHEESKRERLDRSRKELGNNMFLSSLLFTQHFQFEPTTPASRLFAASMALWALLVSSAYTANLASFFVIQNTPQFQVESIDDAIRANLPLCIQGTTATAVIVESNYPKANLIRISDDLEFYEAVNNGTCALAVTQFHGFEQYKSDSRTNPDCKLEWVGRTIQHVPAAFAFKSDSGKLCTSLIHDVLNLHLVGMAADGFIAKAWEEHLARNQDKDCMSDKGDGDDDSGSNKRTIEEMAGVFVVLLFFTVVALVYALGTKSISRWNKRAQKETNTMNDNHETEKALVLATMRKEDKDTSLESQLEDLRAEQKVMANQLRTIVQLLQEHQPASAEWSAVST